MNFPRFGLDNRPEPWYSSIMIKTTTTIQSQVYTACYTAVSELPAGTHPDDIADCVFGMLPTYVFDANEDFITQTILDLI